GAPRGNQRRIAHELDDVAVALLGIEKDRLAGNIFALPLRAVEGARLAVDVPAPFVFVPPMCVVAAEQKSARTIQMGLRKLRRAGDSGLEGDEGFIRSLELEKCAAAVVQSFGEPGPERNGRIVAR